MVNFRTEVTLYITNIYKEISLFYLKKENIYLAQKYFDKCENLIIANINEIKKNSSYNNIYFIGEFVNLSIKLYGISKATTFLKNINWKDYISSFNDILYLCKESCFAYYGIGQIRS